MDDRGWQEGQWQTDGFVVLKENIREKYEFTVLQLLLGAIKYIPPKQHRKTSHVEYRWLFLSLRTINIHLILQYRMHSFPLNRFNRCHSLRDHHHHVCVCFAIFTTCYVQVLLVDPSAIYYTVRTHVNPWQRPSRTGTYLPFLYTGTSYLIYSW